MEDQGAILWELKKLNKQVAAIGLILGLEYNPAPQGRRKKEKDDIAAFLKEGGGKAFVRDTLLQLAQEDMVVRSALGK